MELQKFFDIKFFINNNEVHLRELKIEAFGYSFVYDNPYYNNSNERMIYTFNCLTFQSKNLKNFAILIPELTDKLDINFNYGNADIFDVNYFSAFTFSQSNYYPKINLDQDQKLLTIRSKPNQPVLPGGGILINWKN
jgi:hypothetical protein